MLQTILDIIKHTVAPANYKRWKDIYAEFVLARDNFIHNTIEVVFDVAEGLSSISDRPLKAIRSTIYWRTRIKQLLKFTILCRSPYTPSLMKMAKNITRG